MKLTNLLLIFLSILLVNCTKKNEIDYVVFSGTIKGVNIDSLKIYDKDNKPIQTIYLSKELTFADTLFIPEGYYYLGDFKTSTKLLFLKPPFHLNSLIDSNDEDFSITFEGNGSNENNYLQKKEKFNNTFSQVEKYKYFMALNEEQFLKLSDSIYKKKFNYLNLDLNLDRDFKYYESFSVKYENSQFINNYSKWKGQFIGDKSFSVSKSFPNPYSNYNISDEKLIIHPKYSGSIFQVLLNKHKIIYKFRDINLDFLNILDEEITIDEIKDELVHGYVNVGIEQTKDLDTVYTKYMSIVKNKIYRDEVHKKYINLKKMSKGIVSPMFELYDINNRLVTLESLRGKLVYIDIWGTWCIPCVKEIPALKIIEKEFRDSDIHFVSISVNDEKEKLLNFITENNLTGIQLYAPNTDISFFNDYQLKTVPRFILIDREGKILDANAYNPSDPKLKEQLLEYL